MAISSSSVFTPNEGCTSSAFGTAEIIADPLVIEAQLAHAVKDANGRAYNRTTYLKQRTDMMQRWADYLDKLRAGADVTPFNRAA